MVSVRYRNTPILHYRITPVDFKQALEQRYNNEGKPDFHSAMLDFYSQKTPYFSCVLKPASLGFLQFSSIAFAANSDNHP